VAKASADRRLIDDSTLPPSVTLRRAEGRQNPFARADEVCEGVSMIDLYHPKHPGWSPHFERGQGFVFRPVVKVFVVAFYVALAFWAIWWLFSEAPGNGGR